MSASDWGEILASPDSLGRYYGDSVPAAGDCRLFYVHVDERGESVTVGFQTEVMPAYPADAWLGVEYNTLEFFLFFPGVEEFSVDGWGSVEAARFEVGVRPGGVVSVALGSEGAGIRFRAGSVALRKARVYLAAGGA
ncbi:Imm50 family immunity protein [Streptomyces sp. NPDC004539]|uniref:Imm50 family immunity protein n=1 Tax=Streptomyces sp. NPDC004539 TaxID=3154280 RepID=UPI00339F6D75